MNDIYVDLRNENKWIKNEFNNKDFVSVSDLIEKVEDLIDELEAVKTDYEDFKQDVEDNYKHISISEQLDINNKDFI